MATSTITNTVTGPTGVPISGTLVEIELVPNSGFRTNSQEIVQSYFTTTDVNGLWTATLERNSDITPANSYYIVTEHILASGNRQDSRQSFAFQVGAVGASLAASLVTALPAPVGQTALTVAAGDARYSLGGQSVVLAPGSSVVNTIQATGNFIGLVVKKFAGQAVDLQRWLSNDGTTVLASVSASGLLTAAGMAVSAGLGIASQFYSEINNVNSYIEMGAGSVKVIGRTSTANIIMFVKGMAAQAGNLQQWQDVNDVILATVSENGYFTTRKNVVPADAELVAGEAAYWLDSTNGACKFMIKAKQADGTVRTAAVALA